MHSQKPSSQRALTRRCVESPTRTTLIDSFEALSIANAKHSDKPVRLDNADLDNAQQLMNADLDIAQQLIELFAYLLQNGLVVPACNVAQRFSVTRVDEFVTKLTQSTCVTDAMRARLPITFDWNGAPFVGMLNVFRVCADHTMWKWVAVVTCGHVRMFTYVNCTLREAV